MSCGDPSNYSYSPYIATPGSLGISDNGSTDTLDKDIKGLIAYTEVLTKGTGIASTTVELDTTPNYRNRVVQQNSDTNQASAYFLENDQVYVTVEPYDGFESIISTYPLDYKDRNSTGVPYICESLYKTYKHIPEYQSYIQAKTNNPRLTFIIAAGFLFMPQQAVIDVPFDPYLPYLFMGEETLLAARLWTSGYNIYSPNINIVYHDYTRKDEPKVWNDNISFNTNNKDVIKKVSYLLGTETIDNVPKHLLTDISKYSMGNKRTLAEYLNFSNLDLINGLSSKKWCTI